MKKLAVVALGGNALLRGNQIGTIDQQEKNTYKTCEKLLSLIKNRYRIVITHGNGPQVGNILLRNEAGFDNYKIPKMPLDICVADSQGGIGYMIERQMRNVLNDYNMRKNVVSLITQVLVDINDPAFKSPSKPIGPFYLREEAELLSKSNNWIFHEDARKRGWRRVVASPKPLKVMNNRIVKELVENGHIVIAVGGGGIPIYKHKDKYLEAVEAVIDKDRASSLLAREIKADTLFIITDIPKVYLNFNTKGQKAIDRITISEAQKLLKENHFGSGSMKPKIIASIEFIKNGGKEAIITSEKEIDKDNGGTRIING